MVLCMLTIYSFTHVSDSAFTKSSAQLCHLRCFQMYMLHASNAVFFFYPCLRSGCNHVLYSYASIHCVTVLSYSFLMMYTAICLLLRV